MTAFHDSTDPLRLPEGVRAAWYGAGDYTVPLTEALRRRFPGHILISNVPRYAEAARLCRVLDVETGAASAADCPAFIGARKAAGHDDATIYAALSSIPAVAAACRGKKYRLWVAWWRSPAATREEIAAALAGKYGLHLPLELIWATQYVGRVTGPYDDDELLGDDDFTPG